MGVLIVRMILLQHKKTKTYNNKSEPPFTNYLQYLSMKKESPNTM